MKNATPRARFSFTIHDISRMRRTLFDQELKPLGITRSQWWVLGNLSRHSDTGMIQTELARILEVGKVTVGGLIDRLEEDRLVIRRDDADDRRVKRVFITDRGFAIL
jgi:MarR family transcriptional regulator for hemolysin